MTSNGYRTAFREQTEIKLMGTKLVFDYISLFHGTLLLVAEYNAIFSSHMSCSQTQVGEIELQARRSGIHSKS